MLVGADRESDSLLKLIGLIILHSTFSSSAIVECARLTCLAKAYMWRKLYYIKGHYRDLDCVMIGRLHFLVYRETNQQSKCAFLWRRFGGFNLLYHATYRVAQFFDHMSVPGQGVPFGMVKDKSRVWVAHIVKGYIAM